MVHMAAGAGLEPATVPRADCRAAALPTELSGLVAGEREAGASRKSSPRLPPPACCGRRKSYNMVSRRLFASGALTGWPQLESLNIMWFRRRLFASRRPRGLACSLIMDAVRFKEVIEAAKQSFWVVDVDSNRFSRLLEAAPVADTSPSATTLPTAATAPSVRICP